MEKKLNWKESGFGEICFHWQKDNFLLESIFILTSCIEPHILFMNKRQDEKEDIFIIIKRNREPNSYRIEYIHKFNKSINYLIRQIKIYIYIVWTSTQIIHTYMFLPFNHQNPINPFQSNYVPANTETKPPASWTKPKSTIKVLTTKWKTSDISRIYQTIYFRFYLLQTQMFVFHKKKQKKKRNNNLADDFNLLLQSVLHRFLFFFSRTDYKWFN